MQKRAKSTRIAELFALLAGVGGVVASFAYVSAVIARAFGYAKTLGAPMFGRVYSPMSSLFWLEQIDIRCAILSLRGSHCSASTTAFLWNTHILLGECLATTAIVVVAILVIGGIVRRRREEKACYRAPAPITSKRDGAALPFSLAIGTATGRLITLGHGAGITKGQRLTLIGDDAAQNILVYGGIGAGKTTRMINPLTKQALKQDCGMLAFDIKGDASESIIAIAKAERRAVTLIGVGERPCNLLQGLTPEMASSFLKSALILAGNTSSGAAFWNDQACELARNSLGVLSFVPEHYSLYGLYQYAFVGSFREALEPRIDKIYTQLLTNDPASAELLEAYADYQGTIFDPIDSKTKSNILAQLSTVLSPFTLPALRKAFCEDHPDNVELENILNGDIVLMRLPLAIYGMGAKTAYTLVKLRFFNLIDRRRVEPTWNKTRYIVFLCDEYQEVVSVAKDALSDLNFWDKSRSARCVGIISAQGYSSFRAAIGSEPLTKALLQNFRQKFTFRTEDDDTIKQFSYLMGQVEIEHENITTTRSHTSNAGKTSNSRSSGTNINHQMQNTINPQTFRQLAFGEAFATLSISGAAYDDVIQTEAHYASA